MCDKLLQLNISLHLESLFSKNKKIKSGKIYRHKSIQVSRSTKPFTNHSWQVWRSIYNSHIDFKIYSIVIRVQRNYAHKCTKPLSQRYKAKQVLRQNSIMSIKLFDFLLFMWFLDFWHIRRKRLIKSNIKKIWMKVCKNKQTDFNPYNQ